MRKPRSFSHPLYSRHDERIAALIAERGHAGYGLYWMLIEIIHREQDMRIYYNEHRIRRLSAILGITTEAFKTFVDDLVYVYELLTLEDACLPDRQDYLMSAITYRRPRKPKPTPQPAEPIPSADTEPTANTTQPQTEQSTPFSNSSPAFPIFGTATPPQQQRNDTTTAAKQHVDSSYNSSITAAKSPIIPPATRHHPANEPHFEKFRHASALIKKAPA